MYGLDDTRRQRQAEFEFNYEYRHYIRRYLHEIELEVAEQQEILKEAYRDRVLVENEVMVLRRRQFANKKACYAKGRKKGGSRKPFCLF